jgi:hypothetical protein
MRELIYQALSTNASLTASGIKGIWTANALGALPLVANPDVPFLIIQSTANIVHQEVQRTGRSATQVFDIRAYDERGDYLRIDRLLRIVRDTLLGLVLQVSPSGARCTNVKWEQFGPDSDDPILDKIFKTVTMRLLSNL